MANVDPQTRVKWARLVDRLVYGTEQGKVTWNESAQDNMFIARVGENLVHLDSRTMDNRPFLVVRIANRKGDVVDAFDDEDIDGRANSNREYYNKLSDLYARVRRQLSGADAILDEVIAALPDPDDDIPF